MTLLTLSYVLLGLWLFLRLVVATSVAKSIRENPTSASTARVGRLALLSYICWALLAAGLACLILNFVLQGLINFQGSSVEEIDGVINKLESVFDSVAFLSKPLLFLTLGLFALGGAIWVRLSARRKFAAANEALVERELERLRREEENGGLEDLAPNETMQEVAARIDEIEVLRTTLAAEEGNEAIIGELESNLAQLGEIYQIEDVRRRMNLNLAPEVALPQPENFLDRLQIFFVSRGLLSATGKVGRLFAILLASLAIPTVLGIKGETVTGEVDEAASRLKDSKFELVVRANQEQAENDWKQTFAQVAEEAPEEEFELTEDDLSLLDAFSAAMETESLSAEIPAEIVVQIRPSAALRSYQVRDQMLRRFASMGRSRAIHLAGASGDLAKLGDIAPTSQKPKPITAAGKEFRGDLESLYKKDPSFRERLRAKADSFQTPVTRRSFEHSMMSDLHNSLVDGNRAGDIDTRTRQSMKDAMRARNHGALAELAKGGDIDDTLSKVKSGNPSRPVVSPSQSSRIETGIKSSASNMQNMETLNRAMADHPPALHIDEAPHRVDAAQKTLHRRFVQNGGYRQGSLNSINGFSSNFPSQVDSYGKTGAGRVQADFSNTAKVSQIHSNYNSGNLRSSSGGSPSVRARPKPQVVSASIKATSTTAYRRAGSFRGLRGFSKIGGVLIGRTDDERKANQQIEGFDWEWRDNEVSLIFTNEDGEIFQSDFVDADTLYHGMIYSADRVPVAVTMVTARPIQELKILLHPSLVNSTIGGHIIDLDRFVDQYTGGSEFRSEAELTAEQFHDLYRISWAASFKNFFNKHEIVFQTILSADDLSYVGQHVQRADQVLATPDLIEYAQGALQRPASALSEHSPLKAKSEFYDRELVNRMEAALQQQKRDLDEFLSFVSYNRSYSDPDQIMDALESKLSLPPQFEKWSGVRETDFEPVLSQLIEFGSGQSPLRFMNQVAFVTPPGFGPEANNEDYSDENPWEFPAVEEQLEQATFAGIQSSPRSSLIFQRSSEFTKVQRLFRLIFQGGLGEDFPVEKLAVLAEECEPKVLPPDPTPEWNSRDNAIENSLLNVLLSTEAESSEGEPMRAQLLALATEGADKWASLNSTSLYLLSQAEPSQRNEAWKQAWDKLWEDYSAERQVWVDQVSSIISDMDYAGVESDEAMNALLELQAAAELRFALEVRQTDEFRLLKLTPDEAAALLAAQG